MVDDGHGSATGSAPDAAAVQQMEDRLAAEYLRLVELTEAKDHFLTAVSHELRTPLTSILSSTELLAVLGGLDGAPAELVGIVDRNVVRMLHLIDDLSLLARLEAGQLAVDLRLVDLPELVAEALDRYRANPAGDYLPRSDSGPAGPDLAGPDLAGPDLAGPDPAGPHLAAPHLAAPDLAGPDPAGPDLAGPDLAGPDLAGPDLAGPDPAGPDLAGPDLAGRAGADLDRLGPDRPSRDRLDVDLDLADGPPTTADPERIGQILDHLLSNAAKHTPAGGRLTIRARPGETGWTVTVQDTGMGIPAAEQATILDEFTRGSNARRAGIPGAGLGLAISRRLAQLHGGELSLTSVEGRGTTATLRLPFAYAPPRR
jgi:signal transduction histidine kinase